MRIWPVALGILLLLALLTWLLLGGGGTKAPAYEMTLKAFDDFAGSAPDQAQIERMLGINTLRTG